MEFNELQPNCLKGKCSRHTIISKRCKTEAKQLDCLIKINKKTIKSYNEDLEYTNLVNNVWERDAGFVPVSKSQKNWQKYCRFWKCLTKEEQEIFLTRWQDVLWICENLDTSHIKGKGSHIELKYDIENCVLVNRLVQSNLLDQYKDPLTGCNITKTERESWWERIINGELQTTSKDIS